MYDRIGARIKTLAQGLCWVGIIVSVLSGIGLIIAEGGLIGFQIGIGVAALGAFLSWASSLALYGFGELIENVRVLASIAAKVDMEKRRRDE